MASNPKAKGVHPFALHFVRQTWRETAEIAEMTILDIREKLINFV